MSAFPIEKVIEVLKSNSNLYSSAPVNDLVKINKNVPFKVLLSTIISLRTKDEVTIEASKRLYEILKKPKEILTISLEQINEAIYPCGFHNRKAIQIKNICEILVNDYNSKVPKEINTLLKFPGIGRKTANLILTEGYNIPAICVDTHVHRISNRLGFVKTNNPDETELVLRNILPKKYWIEYNFILVAYGQSICRPMSPKCSVCPIIEYCSRINVDKFR